MWLVFLDLYQPKYPNSPSHEQLPETSHLGTVTGDPQFPEVDREIFYDPKRVAIQSLPHPGPNNIIGLKRNPWFESGVLSKLRGKVNKLL